MTANIDHTPTVADAEAPQFEEDVTPEAASVAGTLLWLFAGLALILLPFATVSGRRPLGWIQEPWSWPFIVLALALVGGGGLVLDYLRLRRDPGFPAKAREAFDGMGRSLTYAAAFLTFIGGVWLIGFTLASILLMQCLYFMSGLRGAKWCLVGFAVTLAIVLAFRVGLGIWFPLPPLMLLFPGWVGNALGEYL
ncbi:tripartite tricarboxylate transporter TctB family protein [Rhizobium leguminosarum]|uniref:tripartite tricarboxylate transporter TctB family protein n=1 Tax=Rhizobium leguminosarum TaxID=384 RepID=UPI001C93F542|nr:tripartite tricarboxylate transporter TctB family protein [Rhizobium leguminosarum]MBY5371057.1 tripartite tricarboxylate transporter TctB family protein [Rhizobium leguminosarum]MBY5447216.1 tripartite tricarboxylate transporter TctB family protein [Rhizobium leguminosarum]